MKFSIPRETLLAPISQVVSVVERRQTLPVLANFLIEAVDEGLRITGTDMEVELVARAPADVKEKGAITVPARKIGRASCRERGKGDTATRCMKQREWRTRKP